jgi:hypothetical protein
VNDLVEIEDKKKEKENRITADKKLCEFMQSLMVKKFGKNIEARLIVRDVNATVWEVHKVNRRSTLLRLMFAPFPLRTKRKKTLAGL